MYTHLRLTVGLIAIFIGCGPTMEPMDTHEAFRQIQVHEATIAHRAAAAQACQRAEPCAAERELCAAVEALCEISRDIDDRDARTRCQVARRHCPEEAP